MALPRKHCGLTEDDFSIFDPTALEIEAELRYERRKKQREQRAASTSRENETILRLEEIDVFWLGREQTSSLGECLEHAESTWTNNTTGEKDTAYEISANTRCRRKAIGDKEMMLKTDKEDLENTRRSTLRTRASQSQASNIYHSLESKGPFKLPIAASTPAYRYGGRRAGVCDAVDETSVARTKRRVMEKRFPDIEDWLLDKEKAT